MKLFSIFQQFKRKRDICAEKGKALYNFKALSCILFYSVKSDDLTWLYKTYQGISHAR